MKTDFFEKLLSFCFINLPGYFKCDVQNTMSPILWNGPKIAKIPTILVLGFSGKPYFTMRNTNLGFNGNSNIDLFTLFHLPSATESTLSARQKRHFVVVVPHRWLGCKDDLLGVLPTMLKEFKSGVLPWNGPDKLGAVIILCAEFMIKKMISQWWE